VWKIKTNVVSVIIGAIGTVSKSLRQYPSNIKGKHEIKGLQKKAAILGTAHTHTHTAGSTDVKVQNIQHGK